MNKYGDQRSEELLESALRHCVQNRGESYIDFYSRVLKTHNELMQCITLNSTDANFLSYKKTDYNKLALKTFQIGLLEPYRSYISNFELNTIEDCLNKCRFYDNRKNEWEYCEFLRKGTVANISDPNKKFTRPNSVQIRQTNHNLPRNNNYNQPPNNNFAHNNQFRQNIAGPSNQQSFTRPQFNVPERKGFEGNINRPLPQQNKFFTNKQVFGTKPGSSISQIRNKPTPMSVQTRLTQQTNRPTYSNNSYNRPPVIVEELFNVESEQFDEMPFNSEDIPEEYQYEEFTDNIPNESEENFIVEASEQSGQ